ncbi:hypothetical protein BST42_16115 [Mycolicibacterium rhodesiae]|uniref:Uncharacterized protein n=1 Tax=Mycolicibacterium rhodesiae TaxID=36814 RepID=A0A1X0IT31_MYCRH|nr:hypothetical protein BST42_16115 [Mycolicibacterium rhodesiae]
MVEVDELSVVVWSPVAGVLVATVVVAVVVAPLAADDGLGTADGCLTDGRFRADPAVVVVRVDFEEVPASLAELALDPESGEPPAGAADATPCPVATASPTPTAAARIPLRAARCRLRATCFRWRAARFRWRPTRL